MLKNVIRMEFAIEGKVGHFLCDNDTPIPMAKEMLFQFLKVLGQIEDNAKAQMAAAEAEKEQQNNQQTSEVKQADPVPQE